MIKTPLVSWSNLAYPLAGLMSRDPTLIILSSVMGFSSFAYHSGLWSWGGFADVAAMYAIFGGLTAAVFLPPWVAILIAALLYGLAWWYAWGDAPVRIGGFWVALVLATCLHHPHWPFVDAGVGAFAIAYGVWLTDPEYRRFGHAAWHILTAVGFCCLRLAVR